jgi:FkbM family methyltransferase
MARYFLSRRASGRLGHLLAPPERARGLKLAHIAGPLRLSPASGGLATYYEIVSQRIYAPLPGFAPREGETVVDVGANIGVFSLWAASLVGATGKIVSIEPTPVAFGYLQRNLRDLDTPTDTVRAACSDGAGVLTLHYPPGRLSVASAEPRPDRTVSVDVPVRRLSAIARDAGLERVDFLKIDVEGLELEVLRGATELLPLVDRLAMEVDVEKLPAVEDYLLTFGLHRVSAVTGMWGIKGATILCFSRSEGLG